MEEQENRVQCRLLCDKSRMSLVYIYIVDVRNT
jgi:hypothetical protein